ncbi:MAG: bifunctional DNA-formamidopyrimidine glycosylase/DNA-(apurinic or apyrimidinic site) lyase [Thermoanaerobaculales bacterium]|nr:bifunctional DNA-formamidopyrimidine glycosylase/DNA-(apurinic or apyrimidinic site) lyase [Thermoanaerobaculales bacterium]
MPELPEVETVRRSLALELPGLRVTAVGGRSIAMRRPLDVEQLAARTTGRRFLDPRRRGKYLLLDLEPPGSLLAHLGMSGHVQLTDASSPLRNHTHLRLDLENGRQLRFVDPRRFGFVDWLEPGAEITDPSLAALGVEPLDPGLENVLPSLFRARRAPLKSLLLDQRLVAGIGNIYAIEALWRAGIHPRRAGNRTSLSRLAGLALSVQETLADAITQGGTTLRDFAGPDGESGYFAVKLNVYGRQGEPCMNCDATIRSAVIGGRTTAWCPTCQR